MIRPILRHPHPALRQVSANAVPGHEVERLIADLIHTAQESKAMGLAAVQIGALVRVCVVLIKGRYEPFINPELLQISGVRQTITEECLSIPWAKVKVSRPAALVVRYIQADGNADTLHLSGLAARALQHEIDHMNGVLIVDYKRKEAAL